jgi:ferric-dicitrate binding protein FerR (iron transport regulator)
VARIDIHIIERNITGCATTEEQSVLHAWLELNQANRDAYFLMKNIWDSCRIKGYSQGDIRREWALLAKQINAVEQRPQQARKARKGSIIRLWMRYAAVFAMAVGMTWAMSSLLRSPEISTPQLTYQQFTVPNGQRTQVILADGTKVWLNAGTTLQYPSDFGVSNRQVILDGEAGFQVVPSDIPFTVAAGKVTITVHGTHFNVRNYSTDDYVETALFEGAVKMQFPKNEVVLKPGELAVYRKEQQTANIKTMPDIAHKFAWSESRLIIDDERLEDIAHMLERWYDVHIAITDDELKDQRYTGKFVYNENISQVMKVISVTTPVQYKIEGREITISKTKN